MATIGGAEAVGYIGVDREWGQVVGDRPAYGSVVEPVREYTETPHGRQR